MRIWSEEKVRKLIAGEPIDGIIGGAFDWASTRQGYNYWADLYPGGQPLPAAAREYLTQEFTLAKLLGESTNV